MAAEEARTISVIGAIVIAAIFALAVALSYDSYLDATHPPQAVEPCTACIEGLNETWDCSATSWQDKGMCERARMGELEKCMTLCGEGE